MLDVPPSSLAIAVLTELSSSFNLSILFLASLLETLWNTNPAFTSLSSSSPYRLSISLVSVFTSSIKFNILEAEDLISCNASSFVISWPLLRASWV